MGRVVAAQTNGLDKDDIEQEIRIRFWQKPPANLAAAWKMARNVRNDLWRTERRHRHGSLDGLDVAAAHGTTDGVGEAVDALYRQDFEKTRWLLNYYDRCRHSVGERATALRYRRKLEAVL